MVVERSVELYTYSIDITQQQEHVPNFNSAKYTLFRKDFPQVQFCKIHLFEIPQSTFRTPSPRSGSASLCQIFELLLWGTARKLNASLAADRHASRVDSSQLGRLKSTWAFQVGL